MKNTYVKTDKLGLMYLKELLFEEVARCNKIENKKNSLENKLFEMNNFYISILNNKDSYDLELFSSLCVTIKSKIESIQEEIDYVNSNLNLEFRENCLMIMDDLKLDKIIDYDQYETIIELLNRKGIDSKTTVKLLEYVKVHNVISNLKNNHVRIDYQNIYNVLDILNYGYEEIPDVKVNSCIKEELDEFVNNIINKFNENDIAKANEIVSNVSNLYYNYYLNLDEYKYVMFNIMNRTVNSMLDITDQLCDIKKYREKSIRYKLADEYNYNLRFYKKIRETIDLEIDNNKSISSGKVKTKVEYDQ